MHFCMHVCTYVYRDIMHTHNALLRRVRCLTKSAATHTAGACDARQMRRAMLAADHAVVGQRSVGKCRLLDDCRGSYLCCTHISLEHPVHGNRLSFSRPPPLKFRSPCAGADGVIRYTR